MIKSHKMIIIALRWIEQQPFALDREMRNRRKVGTQRARKPTIAKQNMSLIFGKNSDERKRKLAEDKNELFVENMEPAD